MLWANVINIGMGIAILCSQYLGVIDVTPVIPQFGIPYLLISVSLNVLLTLMIVIRIVLHDRNFPAATNSRVGISGLYKAASTMLIESCALFAASSLVVVVALAKAGSYKTGIYFPGSYVVIIFFPILAEIQVRAFHDHNP